MDWIQDLRYGARMLVKHPGFSAVAVTTLALGIAANTAIFTVLDAVVLRSLPYREPDRLAVIWVDFGDEGQSLPASSSLDFRDYQQASTLFDGLAAGSGTTANLTGEGDPEQVDLGQVTYNMFPLLGVEPSLGRGFLPDEDVVNGPDVVILSHDLWQRRYGGAPGIIGHTIDVDGTKSRVVGVMPEGFELLLPPETPFLRDSDLWAPLQDPFEGPRNRTLVTVLGRLRKGVTFEQAQEEMDAIAAQLRDEHLVHQQSDTRIRVVPLRQDVVKNVRPALLALFAAVGLVFLIACGNVANLLLARASAREKEMAIRVSLGAGRWRVMRQMFCESAILSLCAGGLGLLLAAWGTTFLIALGPSHLPRVSNVGIHASAFGFTAAICLLTVLVFGLLPAAHAFDPPLSASLHEGGRGLTARGQSVRHVFVVVEVALSLVLLVSVGLLTRSFVALHDVEPGFDPERVLTFRINLPAGRYPAPSDRHLFHDQLELDLAALPGVVSVGAISQMPLTGDVSQSPYAYDEQTEQNWESVTADARVVTPGYFETAGIALRAGRLFDGRDAAGTRLVVLVDEVLARKAWPTSDAVGQRLLLPVFGPEGVTRRWLDVIGVVAHVRHGDLSREGREQVYFPLQQSSRRSMTVLVRTVGDPTAVADPVRQTVHILDPDLPVHDLRTWSTYVSDAMAQPRFTLILGSLFGAVAMFLALLALYGLISYTVSQRTHELGIRVALGASARSIVCLVVRQGLWLTCLGVACGVLGAWMSSHGLSGLLFGVDPADPPTFIGVAVMLTGMACLACYLPARRATRLDPVVALRHD